jgi:hypothetical protein
MNVFFCKFHRTLVSIRRLPAYLLQYFTGEKINKFGNNFREQVELQS